MPSSLGQMPQGFPGASTLLGGQGMGAGQQQVAAGGVGDGLSTAQALEKLSHVTAKLDAHINQLVPSGFTTLASLPAEHEVHSLMRQAGTIAACAVARDETAIQMVQRIFKRMYEQV